MTLLMKQRFISTTMLVKGLEKLSQLEIDADKDWQGYGVTNLAQVTAAMAKGDQPMGDAATLQRLIPGVVGGALTSQGAGNDLTWI